MVAQAEAAANGSHTVANGHQENVRPSVEVVGLQPVALIDHAVLVDEAVLKDVTGERGGSIRVSADELGRIMSEVRAHNSRETKTLAGGSVGNTIRGLAAGFGVNSSLLGACGTDDLGDQFWKNMQAAGVGLKRHRRKEGITGQCACLVDKDGGRTMRPCMEDAVRLHANELEEEDFPGKTKWLVVNGYGFYGEGGVERATALAKQVGAKVSMDLASFEVVRMFRERFQHLFQGGLVDLCITNEDEARELVRGFDAEGHPIAAGAADLGDSPEMAIEILSHWCETVVLMLGPRGCMARRGNEVASVHGISGVKAVDTTGAGDLFASGFLFGTLLGLPLEDCCHLGCSTGGAVVQSLGGEVTPEGWAWARAQWPSRLSPKSLQAVNKFREQHFVETGPPKLSSLAFNPLVKG